MPRFLLAQALLADQVPVLIYDPCAMETARAILTGPVEFMPSVTECQLIKRDGDSIVGYQRLSPKVCADRDYTLRVWKESWRAPDGLVFTSH